MYRRRRVTIMPVIALASLSLMVALPALSSTGLYAAGPTRYSTVTVRNGDTLWAIAAAHAGQSGDVPGMVDRITEANHLGTAPLQPGQRLRVPQ